MANVAMLSTIADQTASQLAGAASALMPSGVILPYAGATAPAGWVECNGQALSQTDYATLFAALGTTYNTQVNPTTGAAWAAPSAGTFRVPDMRGLFLRGEGTASGGDAVTVGGHQGGKTAKNGLGNVSVSGLKNQMNGGTGNESAGHRHDSGGIYATTPSAGSAGGTAVTGGGGGINWSNTSKTGGIDTNHTHSWDFGGSATFSATGTIPAGDNETRPVNRGVKYIIKV